MLENFQGEEYNIPEIVKGTYFSFLVGFEEDITGWGFSTEILSANLTTIHKSFTIAVDTENKQVLLTLEEEDINELPNGLLKWRFFVTDATGKKRRWLYGTIQVKAE